MSASNAKYMAVADTLKREILNGKYESRERFPSEESLVRRFGVSRPTVERALRELKREGLLKSRTGSGSFLTFAALNATGAIGVIAPDYHKIDFFTNLCDGIASAAQSAQVFKLLLPPYEIRLLHVPSISFHGDIIAFLLRQCKHKFSTNF